MVTLDQKKSIHNRRRQFRVAGCGVTNGKTIVGDGSDHRIELSGRSPWSEREPWKQGGRSGQAARFLAQRVGNPKAPSATHSHPYSAFEYGAWPYLTGNYHDRLNLRRSDFLRDVSCLKLSCVANPFVKRPVLRRRMYLGIGVCERLLYRDDGFVVA
ncbi:hypothetical protein WA026_002485 [Henosepilachna vigintioctopunctata]|uniref:Uncharacterized protein n=1 Tax=Henosepilachna vigintioctopunctata TaxID=420089 RepID=A0AAW1U0W3_9CUCU